MRLVVSGDCRDIANSAWVSTTDEDKMRLRSDDDVERVVRFLIKHHHTSPLEVVTLTFYLDSYEEYVYDMGMLGLNHYANSEYSIYTIERDESGTECGGILTIDLLNFIKISLQHNLFKDIGWTLFSQERPILSEMLMEFGNIEDSSSSSVDSDLGSHGMTVDLIHLHDVNGMPEHSRATWRICCPLSVAVQILRHRKGSYNMSSGRYRTLRQDIYDIPNDVRSILDKSELLSLTEGMQSETINVRSKYLELMKGLRLSKNNEVISNDEYKRARECVRFFLPEGRMTELYVTYYLSDFYNNYKPLRDSVHAQKEHIWIAQKMYETLVSQ